MIRMILNKKNKKYKKRTLTYKKQKKYKVQKQEESPKFKGYLLPQEFINQERLDNLKTIEEYTKIYFRHKGKEY